MPAEPAPPPFPPLPRRDLFAGEDAAPDHNTVFPGRQVQYLDEQGRAAYRVHVDGDGLLRHPDGTPLDTADGRTLHRPDDTRAIFVLGTDGSLYVSKRHLVGEFQHSSFLAGAPVAMAGELKVRAGQLLLISNRSHHYRPTPERAAEAAKYLVGVLGVRLVEESTLETVAWSD